MIYAGNPEDPVDLCGDLDYGVWYFLSSHHENLKYFEYKDDTWLHYLDLETFSPIKDFSNNQDRKCWMKCCLIYQMLGFIDVHLVLEVGLRDLDESFHI